MRYKYFIFWKVWGTLAYEDKSTASKALNICDGFEVDGSKIKVWTYEEEKEGI